MKVSDIIDIQRETFHLGPPHYGMGKCYRATFAGRLSCAGETRDAAAEAVLETARAIIENHGEREYYLANDGDTVFILLPAGSGWGYDIIHPGSTKPCSHIRPSSCGMDGTRAEVRAAMMRHLEDY